jgi:hypothetical protein
MPGGAACTTRPFESSVTVALLPAGVTCVHVRVAALHVLVKLRPLTVVVSVIVTNVKGSLGLDNVAVCAWVVVEVRPLGSVTRGLTIPTHVVHAIHVDTLDRAVAHFNLAGGNAETAHDRS